VPQVQEHYCIYEADIKNMKTILTGNGDPSSGICVQIALMSAKIDTLIEQDKERKSNKLMVTMALAGACISVIGTVILAVL